MLDNLQPHLDPQRIDTCDAQARTGDACGRVGGVVGGGVTSRGRVAEKRSVMIKSLQRLTAVLALLLSLLAPAHASAMLDPGLGRFNQRDPHPDTYPDGMNAYAGYHVMLGGVDSSGLTKCSLSEDDDVRSDRECCRDAKAEGLHKVDGIDSAGGVICCDGKKVACVWGDYSKFTDTAEDAMIKCIETHERVHFDHISDCPNKKPHLDRPGFRDGIEEDKAECEAYRKQLECLNRERKKARDEPQAEQELINIIDQIKKVANKTYNCAL